MAFEQGKPISILVLKGEKGDSGEGANNISFANITGNPQDNEPLSNELSAKLEAGDLNNIPHKQDVKNLTNDNFVDIRQLFKNLNMDLDEYIIELFFKIFLRPGTLYGTSDDNFNPNEEEPFCSNGRKWIPWGENGEYFKSAAINKFSREPAGKTGGRIAAAFNIPSHSHEIFQITKSSSEQVTKESGIYLSKVDNKPGVRSSIIQVADLYAASRCLTLTNELDDSYGFISVGDPDASRQPGIYLKLDPKYISTSVWRRVK